MLSKMSTFFIVVVFLIVFNLSHVNCFWDMGTTTFRPESEDVTPRQSFFRWQLTHDPSWLAKLWFWSWDYDWVEIERRRRLNVIAGVSIDMIPLSTGVILNRRVVLTSYNYLDPYMNRQQELRIWALGRAGKHNTPYRYRAYIVHRLLPLSLNPEHCHGARCTHQPRHDVAIIVTRDMMYIYYYYVDSYQYAYKAFMVPTKFFVLQDEIWMGGSGFETANHAYENYKIYYNNFNKDRFVDCSKFLPKWWGKFICIYNTHMYSVQNGGGLFSNEYIVGLGCFEIRYNEQRVFVFTDLRYYYSKIYHYAHVSPGQYYEYAYPQWHIPPHPGVVSVDDWSNNPKIPTPQYDLYPLG